MSKCNHTYHGHDHENSHNIVTGAGDGSCGHIGYLTVIVNIGPDIVQILSQKGKQKENAGTD